KHQERPYSSTKYRKKDTLMSQMPKCPTCSSEYTYEDGEMFVCPECAHEWAKVAAESAEAVTVVRDAFGNELKAGDSITVIKDLKIKGSSAVVKTGVKIKIIRLVSGDHDIDCRIDGVGAMQLKSEFVKKA
ncbi:MAG: zinc ribbon domain-containing protein YjdM, partial [Desulfuromonadaceae bacterium]